MGGLEYIVNTIKQRQQRVAVEGLMKPRDKTAYELGRLSGILEGMEEVIGMIDKTLRDDEGRAT